MDKSRVEVIGHGDLAAPQFGTGEAVYKRLCEEVDVVVHCAAAVKFHLNYTMLKEDNVTATLRIIEFCNTHHKKPLHFMSSVSVALASPEPLLFEDKHSQLPHSACLPMGYAHSKWVCEAMMKEASQWLNIFTYRVGTIGGNTKTGHWTEVDFVPLLWKAGLMTGHYYTNNLWLDWIPVDTIAAGVAVILKSNMHNNPSFQLYHVVNPVALAPSVTEQYVRQHNPRLIPLSPTQLLELMDTKYAQGDFPLLPLRSFVKALVDGEKSPPPQFDCQKFVTALKTANVNIPENTLELIGLYLSKLQV